MNQLIKKDSNEINNDSEFAKITNLANVYIQSTDEPIFQEFLEMVASTGFKMNSKAATGIYKVVYFKVTGKKF